MLIISTERQMTQATKIWYAVTIQDYSMDVEDEMPCIHRVRHTEIAWTTKELTDSDLFEDCYVLGCPDHHDVGRLYLEKNGGKVFEYNGQYIVSPPANLLRFKKLATGSLE